MDSSNKRHWLRGVHTAINSIKNGAEIVGEPYKTPNIVNNLKLSNFNFSPSDAERVWAEKT